MKITVYSTKTCAYFTMLKRWLDEKKIDYAAYSHSGSRSNVSSHILRGLGYTNIINGINQQQVEARYLS